MESDPQSFSDISKLVESLGDSSGHYESAEELRSAAGSIYDALRKKSIPVDSAIGLIETYADRSGFNESAANLADAVMDTAKKTDLGYVDEIIRLIEAYSNNSNFIETTADLAEVVGDTVKRTDLAYIDEIIRLIEAYSNNSEYLEHARDLCDAVIENCGPYANQESSNITGDIEEALYEESPTHVKSGECSFCGSNISTESEVCPRCGGPFRPAGTPMPQKAGKEPLLRRIFSRLSGSKRPE